MTSTLLSPSGLSAVDARWGGLQPGGAYLLVGRAGDGRLALAFQMLKSALDGGDKTLLMSPRSPAELQETAQTVGLDLPAAHRSGDLRLLRVPDAEALAARGDDGLTAAYRDLAALVARERPRRLVIDDFTPFVQFRALEAFRTALSGLVAAAREAETTFLFGLGLPVNDGSRQLLATVEASVDGTIELQTTSGQRQLVLRPSGPDVPAAPPAAERPAEAAAPAMEPPAAPDAADSATAAAEPAAAEPAAPPLAASYAPEPSAPPLAASYAPEPEPPARPKDGVLPGTVVPPPPVDPTIAAPTGDTFGLDMADALMEQGYLVDSGGGLVAGFIPTPPAPFPMGGPAAPSFAPLGAPAPTHEPPPSPREVFRRALDDAYRQLAAGNPFLVVALRMEAGQPEAIHFSAVVEALRSAARPQDRLLADTNRMRAVVLVPDADAGAAAPLFAAMQGHLRGQLGDPSEGVLRAVAAVSVPNGQPFTSGAPLLDYAFES